MQILKIRERSYVKYEIDRQERGFIKKRQIKHTMRIFIGTGSLFYICENQKSSEYTRHNGGGCIVQIPNVRLVLH